jgi:hypothetical protein
MKKADLIREFVATSFSGTGKFSTRDVVDAAVASNDIEDQTWSSSDVGAALQGWHQQDRIVGGKRIVKHQNGEHRASLRWELVPANKPKTGNKAFEADIVDEKADGSMLVTDGVDYYVVRKLEW